MPQCEDCLEELKDDVAICVDSAETVDQCTVHDKCEEVYCKVCWANG